MTPAGIARDTCPFCGERAGVPWWNALPVRVECRACGRTCSVWRGASGVGAFVGLLAGAGCAAGLLPHLGAALTLLGATLAGTLGMSAVTRLFLRLEPPEFGDRGGPS
ncbi:MAG TPA: hypothetical protein VMT03_00185 [Polyangia bacterium]|nr:hypothetical protein [Polyangia bacterium]